MKSRNVRILIFCVALILALSLSIAAVAQSDDAPILTSEDDHPTGPPEAVIPERYQPTENAPAAGAGDTDVYFTPQDQSTSVTLIFLYNTSSAGANVSLQTFKLDGSIYADEVINVPAGELVRISADAVADIGGSWTDPVYIQFSTQSVYARLTLPEGVKADAYVAWNGGAIYDPLAAVPTLNLRFSTDPETIFLPTVTTD